MCATERLWNICNSAGMKIRTKVLYIPKHTWSWLRAKHNEERRLDYLLGLVAFILIMIGTIFTILAWEAARTSKWQGDLGNQLAVKQICTSHVSIIRQKMF